MQCVRTSQGYHRLPLIGGSEPSLKQGTPDLEADVLRTLDIHDVDGVRATG